MTDFTASLLIGSSCLATTSGNSLSCMVSTSCTSRAPMLLSNSFTAFESRQRDQQHRLTQKGRLPPQNPCSETGTTKTPGIQQDGQCRRSCTRKAGLTTKEGTNVSGPVQEAREVLLALSHKRVALVANRLLGRQWRHKHTGERFLKRRSQPDEVL
jgi:hypothetical protein